jgi:serine/threonine protein kinase
VSICCDCTGDYLFDPQAEPHGKWTRDEDHIALIIELLGPFPKSVYTCGKLADRYFNKIGQLINIHDLKPWRLENVLVEKYGFSFNESSDISSFLLPMLEIDPEHRITAFDCLKHKWIASSSTST